MNVRPQRILPFLATIILGMAAIITAAQAQQFQYTYGSSTCIEGAFRGIKQLSLSSGGYIAAGMSFATTTGCMTTSDVYVVQTRADGSLLWSMTYNIGGSDSATDIEPCAGGFIICGVTDNRGGSTCLDSRDIFLLKIDGNGVPVWVNSYGSPGDEIAWDVVVAAVGNGSTTHAGDFIVAGSTTLNPGNGPRDGYLLRTTSLGAIVWDAKYGGVGSNDDYFYAVDESVVAPNAGDVIAVGGSNSWGASHDILIIRADGNTGATGAAPRNAVIYQGANMDGARGVQELSIGAAAGDLLITGTSMSRPGVASSEVYVLRTDADPNVLLAHVFFGDVGANQDYGMWATEITGGAPDLTVGNIIVTGFIGLPSPPGFGGLDVFLQELQPNLNSAGALHVYGGTGSDIGMSVNIATNSAVSPQQSRGFIIAGTTTSPGLMAAGDPQQMYLIKTNAAKQSECNYAAASVIVVAANLAHTIVFPGIDDINRSCVPPKKEAVRTWERFICFDFPAARREGGNENDGVSGVDPGDATAGDALDAGITSYPNPVRQGESLVLEYSLPASSMVRITVNDIRGEILYSLNTEREAGMQVMNMNTDGWVSGTYFITINDGEKSITKQVVVIGE